MGSVAHPTKFAAERWARGTAGPKKEFGLYNYVHLSLYSTSISQIENTKNWLFILMVNDWRRHGDDLLVTYWCDTFASY